MLEILKSVKINDLMESESIFKIFKNLSRQKNTQIQQKLDQFKTVSDFFSFYTNKEINSLFNSVNNLDFTLSNLLDDFSPSENSNLDKYISCVAEICLLLKLILATNDIIKKHLISAKLYLSSNTNEYINSKNVHKKLAQLLSSFLKMTTIDDYQKSFSRKSTSENSPYISDFSVKNISLYNTLSKTENIFSFNNINEGFINNKTPKFGDPEINNLKSSKGLYIKRKICSEKTEEPPKNLILKIKGSQLSINDFIYDGESPKNIEVEKSKKKLKNSKKSISDKMEMRKIGLDIYKKNEEKINDESIIKIIKCQSSISKHCLKVDELTRIYSYFLELITCSYKACLISAEERVMLKKLILSNPKLIKNVYEIHCNGKKVEKKSVINLLKSYL